MAAFPRRRRIQVEPYADHPDDKTPGGSGSATPRLFNPVRRPKDYDRRADQGRDGIQAAAQHTGNLADQHITQGASTDGRDGSENDRLRRAEPEIKCLDSSRDCEETEARVVEHQNGRGDPAQLMAERKRDETARRRGR